MRTGTSTSPPPAQDRSGPRQRASQRHEQADATRALLLSTAERLYAERGVFEVSNRQIAEAAGSANNSAVAYHVGTKNDLIAAISRSHAEPIRHQMRRLVEQVRGSTDPRDHVACLVRPFTDHLASLGTPSWFARMTAQTSADPGLRSDVFVDDGLADLLRQAHDALRPATPSVPDVVVDIRRHMVRVMVVHTCAEQERTSAASGVPTDWTLVGDSLIDAVTSVLLAPVGDVPTSPTPDHEHRS